MAHSVATGAIGGGYGPYSVRLSFVTDIIRLTAISNLRFTPPVQPTGLWIKFRSLHSECEFGCVHNVYERKACLLERWSLSAAFVIPHGS